VALPQTHRPVDLGARVVDKLVQGAQREVHLVHAPGERGHAKARTREVGPYGHNHPNTTRHPGGVKNVAEERVRLGLETSVRRAANIVGSRDKELLELIDDQQQRPIAAFPAE